VLEEVNKKSLIWNKFNAITRYGYIHFFSNYFGSVVVNEFPKSGGSWLSRMISEASGLPLEQNGFIKFHRSIVQCHKIQFYNVNLNKSIFLFRDGRDVSVSLYFHSLVPSDKNNHIRVKRNQDFFGFRDVFDVESNLPVFLENIFTSNKVIKMSWSDFVRKHYMSSKISVRYEDLLTRPVFEVERLLRACHLSIDHDLIADVVARNSFEALTGRRKGEVDNKSFLRSGTSGTYVKYFNSDSKNIFKHFAGDELVMLGYEDDREW
jgi:hypothetical protein